MPRKLLLVLILACLLASAASAQQTQDVVYLKNGSIIRGQVIEQVPSASLKIQTGDGSLFVYRMEEVERITREAVEGAKAEKGKQAVRHGPNELNLAASLNTVSDEGISFTVFQLAASLGRFVTEQLEAGVNTTLIKAKGADASGSSTAFLSLHFPGVMGFKVLPYLGMQAGLGYSGSENSFIWGGYGGVKILTSGGGGAVSIQPFYLQQRFNDGSISNYGFLVGVSIFY